MFYFIGRYLLLSKEGHEIVDLLNPMAKYQLLANNVPRVSVATGSLLQNSPIVCGGICDGISFKDCVVVGQPEMEMKMIEKRYAAASVALDPCTLWIVGGSLKNCGIPRLNNLSSTEFIKLGQPSVKGPDLPFTITSHSMTQYDEKSIYIIGGWQNGLSSNKTWIVDPSNGFQITEGPSLKNKRIRHGCAKMIFNGRAILVVTGGFGAEDSVEILDPSENNVWIPGLCLKSAYYCIELCFNKLTIFQDQIFQWD